MWRTKSASVTAAVQRRLSEAVLFMIAFLFREMHSAERSEDIREAAANSLRNVLVYVVNCSM